MLFGIAPFTNQPLCLECRKNTDVLIYLMPDLIIIIVFVDNVVFNAPSLSVCLSVSVPSPVWAM